MDFKMFSGWETKNYISLLYEIIFYKEKRKFFLTALHDRLWRLRYRNTLIIEFIEIIVHGSTRTKGAPDKQFWYTNALSRSNDSIIFDFIHKLIMLLLVL